MAQSKPQVQLMTTGGTIANPLDVDGYISGEQLVSEVPEVSEAADVSVTNVSSTGSSSIDVSVWFDLHAAITELAESDDPPDGFVVTHGSNSVEETAYFLNLTLTTDIPVACTAAQRNHGLIGNDGDRNLLDAVKVAGAEESNGRGAMVVLNDEIHDSREATKAVSGRPDAWSSGNLGVLGLIDKRDNMKFLRETACQNAPETEFDVTDAGPEDFPNVEVIYSHVGAGPELVEAAAEHADGIILASFPTGTPASPKSGGGQSAPLHEAAEDIPVVLSHRGFDGWPYYDDTFLWGSTLTPQKAAILLALALMETDDQDEIQRMFETY